MKRFIVTKAQLTEYVERKKAEKIFYDIVEGLYMNSKSLNENISHQKANQSVIDNYKRKNPSDASIKHGMLIAQFPVSTCFEWKAHKKRRIFYKYLIKNKKMHILYYFVLFINNVMCRKHLINFWCY